MLPFGASAVAVSYAYFMKSAAQRVGPTAWIDRAQPRSIQCWTSPATLGPPLTEERSARFSGFCHYWYKYLYSQKKPWMKDGQCVSLYRHAEAAKPQHFVPMAQVLIIRNRNISSFSGSINKAVDYLLVSELQECASALHIWGR